LKLRDIYNCQKYDFRLKENTMPNIINKWKSNSIKFTKYYAIDNPFDEGKLILWDYRNPTLYLSTKKNPLKAEYFIWSCDEMISRARTSHHFLIDGTFHHPLHYE